MRLQGRITKWNDERGFGFITSSEGGDSVFIHISSLRQSDRRPSVNESVSYTLGFDSHGRPQANDVQFMVVRNSGPPMNQSLRAGVAVPITFALSFLIALVLLAVFGLLELTWVLLYYGASIITYGCYSNDKNAAQNGAWRTPESTLQLLSLVGGWPGALMAQVLLRHKTRKPSFLVGYWITVIINCVALGVIIVKEISPTKFLFGTTI
jgi:Predicted membrane protein